MRFHGVNLLRRIVKLDGLGALVVSVGGGSLVLVWILRGDLIGVLFKDFAFF